MNPDTNVIPLLLEELKASNDANACCAILSFGEAGTLARGAVPVVKTKMLDYPKRASPEDADPVVKAALEALVKIAQGTAPYTH
jgi:hypothetical protein